MIDMLLFINNKASQDISPVTWEIQDGPRPRLSASLPELVWLLAAVSIAAAPHLPHVAAWISLSLLAAALWRLGAALRRWPLPGRWSRGLLTLCGFLGVLFTYRRISGVDPGSALLMMMLALKLLETRRERDRVVVVLIAWFLLFAGFLREQALWSAGYLMLGMLLGTAALLASTRGSPPLNPLATLRQSARLLLPAVPLALALFLLFPRLPGPFWALPEHGGGGARTGLTDQISLGDISELALSSEVAFRVRFNGPAPPPAELYWRGPVLERFDGRRWQAEPASLRQPAPRLPATGNGPVYEYEIILEPHGQRWLLPLETPQSWTAARSQLTGSGELLATGAIDQRMAWNGRSVAGGRLLAGQPAAPGLTSLPEDSSPRARALAERLRAGTADDQGYLDAVLRLFREEEFYYTLQPARLGSDPVDEFLFDTRSGFCEHYAAAFAVLARAAGIPARIVAGYQGGTRNPIGDYWIVRQSDAHAWVEVLLDDHWVRIDPTSAVAPDRILSGLDLGMIGTGREGLERFRPGALLDQLALSWDAASATWDRWVLAFGPDSQLALLQTLGVQAPSTRALVALLSVMLLVALVLLSWIYGRQAPPRQADPAERQWQRFCRRVARISRPRSPAEGPREYVTAIAQQRPDLSGELLAIARLYLGLRYEGRRDAAALERFSQAVRRFRPPRRAPG
jgi:transglutaminase-like putative cysteine protease